MQVTYFASAAILLHDGRTRVLCDPWLVDGAYYGSWAHYPELTVEPESLKDVDYIYISHIHPDHFDPATLSRLDPEIPVLIHDYRWDYLRDAIESLGFDVIELPHGQRTHLAGDLHINVLAADGCDPERCGNYFGCTWYDSGTDEIGSTQVDSMAVVDDGEHVVVNTNDSPYQLAEPTCRKIVTEYDAVDLLCHQYSAAQFYPQAVTNYTPARKRAERDRVIREKHDLALAFIDLFEPDYYMPFAGEYLLAGSLAHLNEFTANPPRADAEAFFHRHVDADRECVFLNSGDTLDLSTGQRSAPFEPTDPAVIDRYVRDILAGRTFAYERDPHPSLSTLEAYLSAAYENLEAKRERIGYETDTTVVISLGEKAVLELSLAGDGYEVVSSPRADPADGWVRIDVDPRLLKRLFEGPHSAYWADAKIGSHLGISKEPDIYERGLYNCLGSFHTHGRDVDVPAEPSRSVT